jgi:hypothetical protein
MYVVSLSPRRLYLLAESPQYLLDMRPVCPEAELDDMEKRNFLTHWNSNPKPSPVMPLAALSWLLKHFVYKVMFCFKHSSEYTFKEMQKKYL